MTRTDRRALLAAAAAAPLAASGLARAQGTTLKVGSTPSGVPFTFLDTRTNSIQGFMVDVITVIGRDQGFAVEVQTTPFAALIASLTTSRIDVISAAMLATPARRETIDFSDPVYGYGEGLAVKEGEQRPWKSLADMRGVQAGAQLGTLYVEPLRAAGLEVRTYETGNDIMRDLSLGRIQAAFIDAPIMSYNIAQGAFRGVRMVEDYTPSVVGQIGIGTRRNDPIMARINAGLAKLKAGGGLAELTAKWKLPPSVGA